MNSASRKGFEMLNIALIGFLAIVVVLGWSMFNMGGGTQYASTIVGQSDTDVAISTLESTKRVAAGDLAFSSHVAALQVAAAGGGCSGDRLWYCAGQPTPPEPNEVQFCMSEKTKALFNIYAESIKNQIEGASVTKYTCAGVYDKGYDLCSVQDSSQCESWSSAGIGGSIGIDKKETDITYSGTIPTDVPSNRFWYMYYRLYKLTKENFLMRAMQQGLQANCASDQPMADRMDGALKFAIEQLQNQFDQYVECKFEYECPPSSTMTCMNEDCDTPDAKQLCYKTSGADMVGLAGLTAESAGRTDKSSLSSRDYFQVQPSARIVVECIDRKFNIPSEVGTENLRFVFRAALSGSLECRPVDTTQI